MENDREEFEQEQVSKDQEGMTVADPAETIDETPWPELTGDADSEAYIERLDRERRVDRAIERLDAEVAAHEGDDELVCPACGRPYALHGIGCPTLSAATAGAEPDPDVAGGGLDGSTGLPLTGPLVDPAPPTDEPRFGDRLREPFFVALVPEHMRAAVEHIAAAVDQDAAKEIDRLERGQLERARYLRRQVEEAVEAGRYTAVLAPETGGGMFDVLDVEPFLEALGAIFGDRAAMTAAELAETIDSTPWPELTGDEDAAALVDRLEHESAHDRRERASARNEDSAGRVEGVDR